MKITPPRGAYPLVFFLATVFSLGAILLLKSAVAGGEIQFSDLEAVVNFLVAGVLAIPLTIWFVRRQWIDVKDDGIAFSFTRYAIPKAHEAKYRDIHDVVFHDGGFSVDGKPRPYIQFDLKDGSDFWVPLPIFGRRDLSLMLDYIREKGVPLKIEGRIRFVTGRKWKK